MTKRERQKRILYTRDYKEKLKEVKAKYKCTLGDDGAWCDGEKASRCAFYLYVVNSKGNACELGI